MTKKSSIAIVGATGLVGSALIELLDESELAFEKVYCLATGESVGEEVMLRSKSIAIKQLDDFDFSQAEIAIFATPASVTDRYQSRATNKGCRVIRLNQTATGIQTVTDDMELDDVIHVSSPFVTMLSPLIAALDEENGIKSLDVTLSLPAASKGKEAVEELAQQSIALFNSQEVEVAAFPVRAAFNTIPHVGRLDSTATSSFELELEAALATQLEEGALVSVFASHVPVFYGASAKIVFDLKYPLENTNWRKVISAVEDLSIIDEPKPGGYMTPVDAVGKEQVYVSRIRQVSDSRCICYLTLDPISQTVKTVVNLLEKLTATQDE